MNDNPYELIPSLSSQIADAMADRLIQQPVSIMEKLRRLGMPFA